MRLPIRSKMILFIGGPALLILGLALLWVIQFTERQMRADREEEMAQLADDAARQFDEYVSKAARVADTTAQIVGEVEQLRKEQVFKIVEGTIRANQRIFGAALAFEPGVMGAPDELFSPFAFREGEDVTVMNINREVYDWYADSQWEWWHRAKDEGRGIWTAPYFDEGAGNILMTTYSVPIYRIEAEGGGVASGEEPGDERGRFIGVATADINLESLEDEIKDSLTRGLDFVVLEPDGQYLVSPEAEDIMRRTLYDTLGDENRGHLEKVVEEMLSGRSGVLTESGLLAEERRIYGYAAIPSTGWTLITSVSEKDAMAGFRTQATREVVAFLIASILLASAILLMSSRLAKPINLLIGRVHRVADGEAISVGEGLDTGDEIAELSTAFDTMQEKVADREKRLENARETTLTDLLESTPDAVLVVDPDARIRRANAQASRMFGYEAEGLAGREAPSLLPERMSGPPDGEASFAFHASQEDRDEKQRESIGARQDGSRFPVEIALSPFHEPEGMMTVVTIRDISDRKEQEAEIREREARFRTLVSNLPGTVYRCRMDEHWTMEFISAEAERLTGYPPTDFIDNAVRTFDSVIAPEDREGVAKTVEEAVAGRRHWSVEYRVIRADGHVRWVSERGRGVFDDEGSLVSLDGVIADVTLAKEMEVQLREARRSADAANAAKSEFLSHMSHELRTPLNGILGYAQILQRDRAVTDGQGRSIEAIINCGDHLLSLINDVLDLSKIEAGRLEVEARPADLERLLRSVADVVRQKAHAKGIGFSVNVSPEVPRGIVTDAAKLRQILVNLLGNAVKFTAEGGVELRVAETPKGTLRLEVIDSGVGVDPGEAEAIFDPFKQVEAGKAAGGTGLGLAITKRLTESMGGQISLRSEVGKGSTFTVALPLEEVEEEQLTAIEGDETEGRGSVVRLAPGETARILVADDREANRDVLEQLLQQVGIEVVLAEDGEQALQCLREGDSFDLVLMDVRMPKMNGIEAVKAIREDADLKGLKVIAVTASVFPDFRETAIQSGFDDFLGKPFRAEELFRVLEQHMSVRFVEAQDDGTLGAEPAETRRHVAEVADRDPFEGLQLADAERKQLIAALRIKNLTAIKKLASAMEAADATRPAGEQLNRLARDFDFAGLAGLAAKLEASDG